MLTGVPPVDLGDAPTADGSEHESRRLTLDRGVEYRRMRQEIESSLFGRAPSPTKVGRFVILERVGAGGMGTVFSAYDEVLDRKVAVKVLHSSADDDGRARVLEEARAMARLCHPNIVVVHEVGEHDGQVFLTMEFVRGRSLDRWIDHEGSPRSWSEVLAVFRKAGQGLAAAHAAGLVHRDFKPHNVILGDDGAVKVLDFGLAIPNRSTNDTGGTEPSSVPGVDDRTAATTAAATTVGGSLAGTPAYMAPELLLGQPVTSGSDQFSFCVSLYQALYGQLPRRSGRDLLMAQGSRGSSWVHVPEGASVPRWLEAVCLRGLAKEPSERFPSMSALLEALERDPGRARRRWLLGVTAAGLVSAISLGVMALGGDTPDPCEGRRAIIDEVWGDERRQAAHHGVLASGVPYAPDTWSRLSTPLDAYAEDWVEGSTEACRAHARGLQSRALFDLRTICLESRMASFEALVSMLVRADEQVVLHAAEAVGGLPSLTRCADLNALTADLPPPDDPTQLARVGELRRLLARARVQGDLGQYERAMSLADDAREQAESVGYPPLLAEAALQQGAARQEREPERADALLGEALWAAVGAGHHPIAIEALARRVYVRANWLARPEHTADDEAHARALMRRTSADERLRWLLANNLAIAYVRRGDVERAFESYEEALGHAQAWGLRGRFAMSAVRINLANLAVEVGDLSKAETLATSALALAQEVLGPAHPLIPRYRYPLGMALWQQGRHTEARTIFEGSVALHQEQPALSADMVPDLDMLAELALERRDHARALELAERGRALVEDQLGPEHALVVGLDHTIGRALIGLGRTEEGMARHRRALALAEKIHGSDSPMTGISHRSLGRAWFELDSAHWSDAAASLERARSLLEHGLNFEFELGSTFRWIGAVALESGAHRDALAALDRAHELIGRSVSYETPVLAPVYRLRATAQARHGDWAAAARDLEQGLSLLGSFDDDHPLRGCIQAGLARVYARCDPELSAECEHQGSTIPKAARRLAMLARQSYQALGVAFVDEAQALDRWLGDSGRP